MIRVRDCYRTVKCRYGIPSRISERHGIGVIRFVRFTFVFRIDGYPDSVGADWLS